MVSASAHRCEPGDICGDVLSDGSLCYRCMVHDHHEHGSRRPTTYVHSSGDDRDGCLACYADGLYPECCIEPCDDGEGHCGVCGHTVEPTPPRIVLPKPMALPMTGECE